MPVSPIEESESLSQSGETEKADEGMDDRSMPIRDSRAAILDHYGSEGDELRRRGKALCERAMVPTTLAVRPSKRGPGDQGDRESARRALSPSEADRMDDALIPLNLERERGPKRMASEDAFNEYGPEGHGGDEKKGPRYSHPTIDAIDAIEVSHLMMSRLELEEGKVARVATEDYCKPSLPMTVLEDSTDLSWVQSRNTRLIG
jgi:hypothetical protein